jgi:hypothetical protein
VSRPRLLRRLAAPTRVTVVSAPPGSGKTVLLRSWISQAGLAGRGESDPQRFWPSVLRALRQTAPGSELVRPLTAAPDLDGWAVIERLLSDLAPLADRIWLVIDDVHELGPQALGQLELLVMRAPEERVHDLVPTGRGAMQAGDRTGRETWLVRRATCTPSSARTAEPTPSPAPAPSACSLPPRTGARPRIPADDHGTMMIVRLHGLPGDLGDRLRPPRQPDREAAAVRAGLRIRR